MVELLSNVDIEEICQKLSINLIQCTSKNTLNGKPVDGGYVINLQNAFGGGGSHWTAFYIRNNECIYFDSFGETYPNDVYKFVKQTKNMNLNYSSVQIQDLLSTSCGWFCIAFLHYMENHKSKSLYNVCNEFTNMFDPIHQQKNDAILQSIIKKLF